MSGKQQLEINIKLCYFQLAWGQVSLTNSDKGQLEVRIREGTLLGPLLQL